MGASTGFPTPNAKGARLASGGDLAAGLAGILASSCCVLPLVFVGVGLGSVAAAVIPALAASRPYLLAAAVVAVAVGWVSHVRGRRASLCLGLTTAVVVLALIRQQLVEPRLLAWMR